MDASTAPYIILPPCLFIIILLAPFIIPPSHRRLLLARSAPPSHPCQSMPGVLFPRIVLILFPRSLSPSASLPPLRPCLLFPGRDISLVQEGDQIRRALTRSYNLLLRVRTRGCTKDLLIPALPSSPTARRCGAFAGVFGNPSRCNPFARDYIYRRGAAACTGAEFGGAA